MKNKTPLSEEFAMKVIEWILTVMAAAAIGLAIYHWNASRQERYDKQSELNARPI